VGEIKQNISFVGAGLDTDSNLSYITAGDGLIRRNILIGEDGDNGRITNMKGNEAVTVSVNNEDYVGSYHNPDTRYTYWLGHDAPTSTNTLVKYHVDTKVATVIFEDTANYFEIDPTHKMKDWDMIGDLLFFNPQTSEPKMINVVMAENYTTYSAWSDSATYVNGDTRRYFGGVYTANTNVAAAESPATNPEKWDRIGDSYDDYNNQFDIAFNVIKKPPTAPTFVYGSDNDPDALTTTESPILTREINNLRGKMFRFASRYIYFDDSKSVYSALSSVTRPIDDEQYDGEILEDLTTNNKLTLTVDLGHAALVQYVEIVFQEIDGDWKVMTTLDRQNPDNIDNSSVAYDFYNDKAYEAADNDLIDIIYDAVPKKANCQEIINKNILCYGGVTEGFDNIDKYDLDVSMSVAESEVVESSTPQTIRHDNVSADLGSEQVRPTSDPWENYATIDVSDFGSWGLTAGDVYKITVDGQTNIVTLGADDIDTVAHLLAAMANAAVSMAPIVWARSDLEQLWIGAYEFYPSITTSMFYEPSAATSDISKYSTFKSGAVHPFCIYYYDEALRRGDSQVSEDMKVYVPTVNELGVSTVNYRERISWSVNHTPPSWAKYWRWGYAGNTLCSWFVQYVITDVDDADSTDALFNNKTTLDITPLQTLKTTETAGWNKFPESIIDPYEWQRGDRVRVITEASGVSLGAPIVGIYDYEILEYDDTSKKIVIQSTNLKALQNAGAGTLIELYRPLAVGEKLVYYEFGSLMPIVDEYHWGTTQNQTVSVPATGTFSEGDVYLITRTPSQPIDTTVGYFHESAWYSDFYLSEEWSKGKIGFESTFGEVYLNIIRYSNQYLQNTKVNGLSTFEALSYKELNDLYGEIKFMVESGDTLKVYQTIKSASIQIGRTEYTDTTGSTQVVASDKILGSIRYSFTNYGTVYPTSITQNNRYIYGFDIFNGVVWRDSANGLFPISGRYEAADAGGDYKMQTYFKSKAAALLTSGISNTLVQTVYDEEYKMLYVLFSDSLTPANNDVIAYHEPSNRWISFYDFVIPNTDDPPCWVQSIGMSFLSFAPIAAESTTTEAATTLEEDNTSSVWRHNSDNVDRCSFYGTTQDCVVQIVANENGGEVKILDSLEIHSNKLWSAVIEIPENINYYRGMYSIVPKTRFRKREGILMSEFMRNGLTTSGAIRTLDYLNGEALRGYAAKITLTNDDTTKVSLLMVNVNMSNSKV